MDTYTFKDEKILFSEPLNNGIEFDIMLKIIPVKGNIVYEYNPFRNYRINEDMFEYKGHMYTISELNEMGITSDGENWFGLSDDDKPELYESGCIVDFETDQLKFSINNPVNILPQYSYDGSVNLIINDGNDIPRLINSRFSCIGRNKYEIVDRKGDNDVNIYDRGGQFDIDTSLYKRVVEIPTLRFLGIGYGGNLPVGNYVLYFKYSDDDGNETDFVAESGPVSLFIGNSAESINGGIKDMNSSKIIKFMLENIDPGYSYVNVYITRKTSAESGDVVIESYRLNDKFQVSKSMSCRITITNLDNATKINNDDINIQYCIASAVYTQASVQNRLFLGNIKRPNIDYKELADLSLRILPTIVKKQYNNMDFEYSDSIQNKYIDPQFIYNYTGYANNREMYCFGIVYILSDNTLSPVFPVRGRMNIDSFSDDDIRNEYSYIPIRKEVNGISQRVYISSDEDTGEIISVDSNELSYTVKQNGNIENSWGITSINVKDSNDSDTIYGINMKLHEPRQFMKELINLGIKGMFFVRQKRIPIILCQAITIGTDKYSQTPVIPVDSTVLKNSGIQNVNDPVSYISERFINDDRKITNDFMDRLYVLSKNSIRQNAAVCPDYDCNEGYFNSIFNGSKFYTFEANFRPIGNRFSINPSSNRELFVEVEKNTSGYDVGSASESSIITVNNGAPIVASSRYSWRGRSGAAEESFRFEYLERENKVQNASNILRGNFGNYIGIDGIERQCSIINIASQEYILSDYEKIKTRHNDKSQYYAISDRIAIKDFILPNGDIVDDKNILDRISNIYRGDSFICMFTHRFNYNFIDPDTPNNDKIVDEDTWINGYKLDDNDFSNINRGDVNAVQLGIWMTFPVISYRNLNIRSLDSSYPDEEALTGHKRGFYPYYGMSVDGSFKIPESSIINTGLSQMLGERWNFPVPDVPYIKNHFQNRILYSDVHVNDAFKNGFRVFQATSFKDYPMTYGSITKLVNVAGNLLCVFEHGITLIPVNERIVSGEGVGGSAFINTPNVLPENPKVISDIFGSQWQESIIRTPRGVYGVDTVAKKIWRTDGEKFEVISDFKIQQFLNLNITLTERELLPIIGVRNVKTHFNRFKNDVMFTFYDDTVGFEEKVWNICYNEILDTWVTFYSWLPSYSENIDNIYFSFDRDTSKWIAKLGMSKAGNSFSEGIVLSENIFKKDEIIRNGYKIGDLDCLVELPDTKTGISYIKKFSLQRDNFGNYKKYFEIKGNSLYLRQDVDYDSLIANIFKIDVNNGRRIFKNRNEKDYRDTIVYLLNIRCDITLEYEGDDNNIKQYVNGWNDNQYLGMGYYEYSVAVMPYENMMFLTTDFWKHGQSGIIDIKDEIKPCVWYGKQHPFEFEFVVVDDSSIHKIFDCLEIIGNKSEPDSFHYEIIGDTYRFSNDKENMYFRQESTKAMYQYNGSNILYNHDFVSIIPKQRNMGDYNDRSTMFPLYYARQDTFNNIEDYYKKITSPNSDYSNMSGAEIVQDKVMNEYHIWVHKKAVDIRKNGVLRGDISYDEDKWYVQAPLLNILQKNEENWRIPDNGKTYINDDGETVKMSIPPINLANSPVPGDLVNTDITNDDIPNELKSLGYTIDDIDLSEWTDDYIKNAKHVKSANIRDKWCKIRIRYTGEKMTIVQAVRTLYTASSI